MIFYLHLQVDIIINTVTNASIAFISYIVIPVNTTGCGPSGMYNNSVLPTPSSPFAYSLRSFCGFFYLFAERKLWPFTRLLASATIPGGN